MLTRLAGLLLLLLASLLPWGCVSRQTLRGIEAMDRTLVRQQQRGAAVAPGGTRTGGGRVVALDQELAQETRLERVLQEAERRNPDPQEALARARAALHRVDRVARLPDLQLMAEVSNVPLAAPHRLDEAGMIKLGLRQGFAPPGTTDALARGALEGARADLARRDQVLQDLATQVRRVFFLLLRQEQEQAVLLEQVALTSEMMELARVNLQAGRGGQGDVLRLALERARLRQDLALLEQRLDAQRALLNTLMARAPDAPLGPAVEPAEPREEEATEARHRLDSRLPELRAARHEVRAGEAALDAARAGALWPGFFLGTDYVLMPMADEPHGYGVMMGVNLPWLNAAHSDEVKEAEGSLARSRLAQDSARNMAGYRLREAALRSEGARRALAISQGDVLVLARQSLQAARAAYAAGQTDATELLDTLRSHLQARLEQLRARLQLELARADLARAAGLASVKPVAAETERP